MTQNVTMSWCWMSRQVCHFGRLLRALLCTSSTLHLSHALVFSNLHHTHYIVCHKLSLFLLIPGALKLQLLCHPGQPLAAHKTTRPPPINASLYHFPPILSPVVSWTSFLVLATVFSKPQLMAALARVEKAAAEQYGKARLNLPGSSPWETLVRGGGHWCSRCMDMACQGMAALAGAGQGGAAAPILGAYAAGRRSYCRVAAQRYTRTHVGGVPVPVPGIVAVARLLEAVWSGRTETGGSEVAGRPGTRHPCPHDARNYVDRGCLGSGLSSGAVTAAAYTHALLHHEWDSTPVVEVTMSVAVAAAV